VTIRQTTYSPARWSQTFVLNRRPTPAEDAELLLVPGLRRFGAAALSVPANATAVAEHYLNYYRIGYTKRGVAGRLLPPPISAPQWHAQWSPGILDKLRSWQREAPAWAYERPGALFYHPAGSGKTWTGFLAAAMRQGAIVELTRSAPRPKHVRDFAAISRWTPFNCKPESARRKKDRWQSLTQYLEWCRLEARPLEGWGPEELWGWRTRPVIVMSWDQLKTELPILISLARKMPLNVIFDELHIGKSKGRWEKVVKVERDERGVLRETEQWAPKDNRVAAAMQLSRAAARRIGTTATPTADRLTDWWGQLDLLDPFGWGSFWDFAKRYGLAYQGEYGMVPDNPNIRAQARPYTPELFQRRSMLVHEVPRSVVDAELPPMMRIVATVAVEDQCKPAAVKSMIKAAQKLGRQSRMEARLIEAAARKRPWVQGMMNDWVETGKGKVAVFCGRKRDVSDWAKRFRSQFKGTKSRPAIDVYESTGEDSGEVRDAKRRQFMDHPGPCILVVTTDAWGESIDLQDLDIQVITQLPFTPRQVFQVEGRGQRLGKDRPHSVIYAVAEGTIDERLSAIMLEKLPDVQAMSEDGKDAGDLSDRLSGGVPDPEALASELLELLGVEDSAHV
jgi:hypothetical protein